MKHHIPEWVGDVIASLGALILLVTQAKRIWGWLKVLWNWQKRRANALPDLAKSVGQLADSFKEIVRVTEARFSNVESKMGELHKRAIVNHQQTLIMLEESPVPQWQCSLPTGVCEWVNPAAARLFGMETHAMLMWGWLAAIHADDLSRVQNEFLESIRKGIPYKTRYRILSEGQPLTVEASGKIVSSEAGEPLALIGKVTPLAVHL